MNSDVQETVLRMRMDAARWVRPEGVAPLENVTPRIFMHLLSKYAPLRAMVWFRLGNLAHAVGVRGVPSWVQRRLMRIYGLELEPAAQIGGGLYIAHPVGCVLSARKIGSNVTVISNVTFGTRDDAMWPTIGDGAFIGVGARILGGVDIGARGRVGANAVVIHDVPAGATAVGIPARIVASPTPSSTNSR